jgi:capsular polysaccharide export protein
MHRRSFLLLQGPLSPLYRRLAEALEREGHQVCRINLCFGDWLHWRRPGGLSYRGRPEDWPEFVTAVIRHRRITDVILHGDQRPYHKAAADVARAEGVRVIVTELGYLRPDWMTLELDGTSAGSHFPRSSEAIRQLAARSPEPDMTPRHGASFWRVAAPDVIYNLSSTALWFLYPHFRRHTIYFPPVEYAAWIGRLLTERRRNARAIAIAKRVTASGRPFFVLPLQLEGDFQIRVHSPFPGQTEGLDHILGSFARAAPPESLLLIKSHPLDNGLERWGRTIFRLAHRHGVSDRVDFLDGSRLDALWPHARGAVTINSSAGLEAVIAGVPVKALGPAIYDVPGLTHQGHLEAFWGAPEKPDPDLARDFVRALAKTVQVRGTIYLRDGLDAAVAGMTRRILEGDFLV